MSDHTQEQQQQETNSTPLFKIGEREYDVESAKTKIEHADKHVQTVESEASELRKKVEQLEAQLANSSKLDQVLETLQANQVATPTSTEGNTTQSVDKEALMQELLGQIAPKIEETFSARQRQEQLAKSFEDTVKLAQERYGSEYESKLREQGNELGMSDADIREMASTKPEAFKRLFGLKQGKVASQATPQSSVNTTSFANSNNNSQDDYQAVSAMIRGFSTQDKVNALHEARKKYSSR